VWGSLIPVWGLLLNAAPYMVTHNLPAFAEGLSMLASGNLPNNGVAGFIQSMADLKIAAFWLVFTTLAALCLGAFPRGGRVQPIIVLTLACTAGLGAFILATHSWPSYSQMFAGFLCLLLISLFDKLLTERPHPPFKPLLPWAALTMPLALAALFVAYSLLITTRLYVHGFPEPEAALKVEAFQTYLTATHRHGVPFLSPSDMNLHWRLHESHHGFPHASHTGHIFAGWWSHVSPHTAFATPNSTEAYCHLLEERGPPLYVAPTREAGLACMDNPTTAYTLDALLPYGTHGQTMAIYLRNNL
ncbi:MAG: hypothetical protein WAZ18_07395, partial [Alphaproteobacteria bacterium]